MTSLLKYPAYNSFVDSVRLEAEQNVRRLRHHPSLVIWGSYPLPNPPSLLTHGVHIPAGNNEGITGSCPVIPDISSYTGIDYALAESLQLELDYSDETGDFRDTNFPARYIYERVLPSVISENSSFHYHRGSPYSGHGKPSYDQTYGDIHQWNVWHGSQEPWSNWDKLAGRFVSEFGMWVIPPASATLEFVNQPNLFEGKGTPISGPSISGREITNLSASLNHGKRRSQLLTLTGLGL